MVYTVHYFSFYAPKLRNMLNNDLRPTITTAYFKNNVKLFISANIAFYL